VSVVVVALALGAGLAAVLISANRRGTRDEANLVRRWPTGMFLLPRPVWLMTLAAGVTIFVIVIVRGH
jgi:hypothetical protein